MATMIASISLGLAVLLDVTATVVLARSSLLTPLQKALQLAFTWIVPFVGSIIVIAILKDTAFASKVSPESDAPSDAWLPGIGPQTESPGGHHGEHLSGDASHGSDAGFGGH